jgi:hypothetical protein
VPAADLDFEVLRKGRHYDEFDVTADPADTPGLRQILRDYLAGEGWDEGLWPQFSAHVRMSGKSKVIQKVRG